MHIERVTKENFSESEFLRANPDVRCALEHGLSTTPYEHFLQHQSEIFYQYKTDESPPVKTIINKNENENLLNYLKCDLEDLSVTMGNRYRNIWGIKGFSLQEKVGISSQFLDDSETYHRNYFNPEGVLHNLRAALQSANLEYHNPTIFDLGSGSGNSVFACKEHFGECGILATDLSQELLVILNRIKEEKYPNAHIKCVAIDALSVELKPKFDIFLGSSILHHVLDVERVFKTAYSCLNKTGCAIFFEPMLSGITVAATLYALLLQLNNDRKSDKIPKEIQDFIGLILFDYEVRTKSRYAMEAYKITDLDDKWIFTIDDIEKSAYKCGFDKVIISSLQKNPHKYKYELNSLLLTQNIEYLCLPAWAQDIVDIFDRFNYCYNSKDISMFSSIVLIKS